MSNNPSRKVGVAVVGLGWMGVTHIKACLQLESANLVAVVGRNRLPMNGVLSGVGGNVGGGEDIQLGTNVKVYSRFEDVLADPAVELVSICVPTPLHVNMTVAALRAGKHVICEKPLARTSARAREIIEAAKNSRGYFMPAMCMRFWPGWASLNKIVGDETYGKVLTARFRRVSSPPATGRDHYFNGTESGGALFDFHIHDVDFVQFLFGRPLNVYSTGQSRFSGAIDHVVTQYKVVSGVSVYTEGSWLLAGGFAMAYTVNFERATLNFDSTLGAEALTLVEEGKTPQVIALPAGDGYVGELRYIMECIRNGTPPAIVTGEDGLQALEICEAEEQSVKTGKIISLV